MLELISFYMNLAIIVPFYNEEKNLKFFINEWNEIINLEYLNNINLKFFFINDGSTDNSLNVIDYSKKNFDYEIINKKNSGHGDSCKYGFKLISNKNFDWVLQIDSDNQCDPKYLKDFISCTKRYDIVFGKRVKREDGLIRILISRLLSILIFIKTKKYINDMNCPYKMFSKEKLNKLIQQVDSKYPKKIELFNCLIAYEAELTYKVSWINIEFRNRKFGISKYNFLHMFKLFLELFYRIR